MLIHQHVTVLTVDWPTTKYTTVGYVEKVREVVAENCYYLTVIDHTVV